LCLKEWQYLICKKNIRSEHKSWLEHHKNCNVCIWVEISTIDKHFMYNIRYTTTLFDVGVQKYHNIFVKVVGKIIGESS